MKEIIRVTSIALATGMLFVLMCTATVFAGESIKLKDVNSTNYFRYVKPVKAAYGYNKGECKRKYLPHEEHFYSEYYDHWNVDVVYDYELIEKLYTGFERTKPVIKSVRCKCSRVLLKWKSVKGAEKYIVYGKKTGGSWKRLATVRNGKCTYTGKLNVKNGAEILYKVQGVKHVRLWDVKTKKSDTAGLFFIAGLSR